MALLTLAYIGEDPDGKVMTAATQAAIQRPRPATCGPAGHGFGDHRAAAREDREPQARRNPGRPQGRCAVAHRGPGGPRRMELRQPPRRPGAVSTSRTPRWPSWPCGRPRRASKSPRAGDWPQTLLQHLPARRRFLELRRPCTNAKTGEHTRLRLDDGGRPGLRLHHRRHAGPGERVPVHATASRRDASRPQPPHRPGAWGGSRRTSTATTEPRQAHGSGISIGCMRPSAWALPPGTSTSAPTTGTAKGPNCWSPGRTPTGPGKANVADTCFATLFLYKGRAPILFEKLDCGPRACEWNNHRRDLANLTAYIERNKERRSVADHQPGGAAGGTARRPGPVHLGRDAAEVHGRGEEETPRVHRHRRHDPGGGLVRQPGVKTWFTEFAAGGLAGVAPQAPRPRPPRLTDPNQLKQRPEILGIDDGLRTCVFYAMDDISCPWQTKALGGRRNTCSSGASTCSPMPRTRPP